MEKITGIKSHEITGYPCEHRKFFYYDRSGGHPCTPEKCILVNAIKYGIAEEKDFYLHHKDGFQVPVSLRATPLRNAHNQVVGAVGMSCVNLYKMAGIRYATEQELMAYIDPVTRIGNRRYVEMNVQRRLEELCRYSWSFGILFIDLDHFKKINDLYGHDTGDEVLKSMSSVLQRNLRSYDGVGRWGGEEFIATVQGVKANMLSIVANRLRQTIERNKVIVGVHNIKCTISLGATLGKTTDTVDGLLTRADGLMYHSKKSGRNCVSTEKLC